MSDLRTAAAAFEADLSEDCDGPLRDALRAALAQNDGWQGEVAAEIERARTKFPMPNPNLAALMEEVGELAEALLKRKPWREVRAEAVQVAVMAQRVAEEGDTGFKGSEVAALEYPNPPYGRAKDTPAPTAAIEGASGGPALKCYQPDCDNGRLYTYENQSVPCPDCTAPEVKP